jgi:hypothetical protein
MVVAPNRSSGPNPFSPSCLVLFAPHQGDDGQFPRAASVAEMFDTHDKSTETRIERLCLNTMRASTTGLHKRIRPSAPYSSKIIKAGALIGDTKTLLSHGNFDASVDENIRQVQRDNVFGKASRSRVDAILAILRQRYLTEESATKALVTLVRKKFPNAALGRLFYFHSARADQLLRDAVIQILVPMQARVSAIFSGPWQSGQRKGRLRRTARIRKINPSPIQRSRDLDF